VRRAPTFDTLEEAAEFYAELHDEVGVLRGRLEDLDARLERRLAEERGERQEEIQALRDEWRNLGTAIAANSTALANAASQLQAELAAVRSEQTHQSGQLRLIGQAMELLLQTEGLEMPHE
jgi:chromosome segregation ATPase